MCTIATAKVQRNYNCYNVYFNECLPITVVVVCTIATAKVPLGFAASLVEERNYNCYNVYFNECLHYSFSPRFWHIGAMPQRASNPPRASCSRQSVSTMRRSQPHTLIKKMLEKPELIQDIVARSISNLDIFYQLKYNNKMLIVRCFHPTSWPAIFSHLFL